MNTLKLRELATPLLPDDQLAADPQRSDATHALARLHYWNELEPLLEAIDSQETRID